MTRVTEEAALRVLQTLEHPGGNVTAVIERPPALRSQKEFALLNAIVPRLQRVGVLTGGTATRVPAIQAFAEANGITLNIVNFSSADELEAAFDKLAAAAPQALFVGGGPATYANLPRIAQLATARKWASVSENRELPENGGLMSYGGTYDAHEAARLVVRILKGGNPADIPASHENLNWQLVLNLRTAAQLGLIIPDSLIAQAAELIKR
jgi:ABC-type uncharacterized transport system substrate-binding protein